MFHSLYKVAYAAIVLSVLCGATSLATAEDGKPWQVQKVTGEVWVTRANVQKASLNASSDLQPGDNITTGRNGRVLLVRGEERIVISPNSAVGISAQTSQFPTTITQKTGSIELEVEKRNVQHFEVETPYLAAVVKGTRFRVTVDNRGANVDVLRGQVQVADFKTGQNALVLPGQAAGVTAQGNGGLSLSGKGRFNPIERGTPRSSSVQALAVPKNGLTAPRDSLKMSQTDKANQSFSKDSVVQKVSRDGVRIGKALGELKLDVHKVTKGLAHSPTEARVRSGKDNGPAKADGAGAGSGGLGTSGESSFASASPGGGNGGGGPGGNGNSGGNGGGNGNGNAGGNGGGNGNGNAGGNGNGNGNGAANGNAGGNGNGKGKGHAKK